jgi:NADPH-ferrihemoprotein reductase
MPFKMDNSTLLGVGVGIAVVVATLIAYQNMSASVPNNSKSSSSNHTTATSNSSSKTQEKTKKKESSENKYPAGKLFIYFGSQTGTSEGFARTLMEEGKNNGFDAKTVDLEDFDADTLQNCGGAVIFLMATYGEGEPTDNAAVFAKWLHNEDKSVDSEFLSNIRYCVFGLGNRQYEHYNRMGKLTDSGLELLGARRIIKLGEGDDDGTLEEDFDAWKTTLWPEMYTAFHPGAASDPDRAGYRSMSGDKLEVAANVKVQLTFNTIDATVPERRDRSGSFDTTTHKVNSSTKHFFTAPLASVLVNRELRTISKGVSRLESGSTKHIEFDLHGTEVTYHTADNLAILPYNSSDVVEALAASLGYDLNYVFDVSPIDASEFKFPFPTPCSIRSLLTEYLDIQGLVKHSAMKHLLTYVTDATQKDWLIKILHKDNRAQFKSYVEDDGKSLADILTHELSSAKIPLSDLIHIASYLQPRYYTISSSSSVHPSVVHITISITQFALKSGRVFTGVASKHLDNLCVGDKCRVYVRASSFRLPSALSTPIVMIGPGTGLAPMRALLQEREFQAQQQQAKLKKVTSKATNVLFFGCKNKKVDYIYREELEGFESRGVLSELRTAFSRDGPAKVYVQELMSEPSVAASLVNLLFTEGAYVFVCGATAMGTDVMAAVHNILQTHKGMSAAEASAYVKELHDKGRYVQELWTA